MALVLVAVIAATGGPSIAAAKSKVIGTLAVDGITTAGPVPILAVDWDVQIVGGKAAVSSFVILKFPDAASPLLFLAALSGSPSLSAQIIAGGKGGASTTYDLADVVVSRVNVDPGTKGVDRGGPTGLCTDDDHRRRREQVLGRRHGLGVLIPHPVPPTQTTNPALAREVALAMGSER